MPRTINLEAIEAQKRWADIEAPSLAETLRRLKRVQVQEAELQARAWLKDEYYDIWEEEDADSSRSD